MFGLGSKYSKSNYREELSGAQAQFKTNQGEFTIELYVDKAPETVWNFINLAEGRQENERSGNFYDGLIFHRVIEGFMIQGGCPLKNGTGNPGYKFADEIHPELRHDSAGILSMANAGPGTNGSQFFITLAPTPHLDGRHTVFGKVLNGMDTVFKIGSAPTGRQDRPVEDIVIESVEIVRNS